jgi:lipopolysaccharide export LptBFGC system permease protein LptF
MDKPTRKTVVKITVEREQSKLRQIGIVLAVFVIALVVLIGPVILLGVVETEIGLLWVRAVIFFAVAYLIRKLFEIIGW